MSPALPAAVPAPAAAGRHLDAGVLLDAYAEHVATLPVTTAVRADRYRAAARFVDRHPDLVAWMGSPTPKRLAELHRAKAWPFL